MNTMNVTRFFLMIALASFALVGFTTNDIDEANPKVRISIDMAKLNPGFAKAIYQQVDMSILNGDDQGIFTAPVKFNRTAYIVFGTYDQWMNFFTCDRSVVTKPRFDF